MCSFHREIIPFNGSAIKQRWELIKRLENADIEEGKEIMWKLQSINMPWDIPQFTEEEMNDWIADKKDLIYTSTCRGSGYSLQNK